MLHVILKFFQYFLISEDLNLNLLATREATSVQSIRYQVLFYFWRMEPVLEFCKMPKYYAHDCSISRRILTNGITNTSFDWNHKEYWIYLKPRNVRCNNLWYNWFVFTATNCPASIIASFSVSVHRDVFVCNSIKAMVTPLEGSICTCSNRGQLFVKLSKL